MNPLRRRRWGAAVLAGVLAASGSALAAEPAIQLDLGEGVALHLVLIPAGTFVQGSPPTERGREPEERQHEVEIRSPYYLGKVPVTVGQYARFVAAAGYRTEAERGTSGGSGWDGKALVQKPEFNWKHPGFPQTDDHPVTLVTYEDALVFTAWLSRTQGRTFSLPTEAQWEHGYRAATHGAYYDGVTDKDALAIGWFKPNSPAGTHPVGQRKPNAFGLHDMAGNVFEWCLDWFAPYPAGPVVDPLVTEPAGADKARRVLRGGSWLKDASHGRAAARYRNTPGSRNADNGFRVAALVAAAPAAAPTSGPQPPATPPPSQPPPASRRPSDNGAGAVCLGGGCLVVVGALLLIVGAVGRRKPRARASAPAFRPAPSRPTVRLEPGPDGFRVFAPPSAVAWTLIYGYRGPGGPAGGQVLLEPSNAGQLVYTGFAPVDVVVVDLVAPGMQHVGPPGGRQRVVHHHHHSDDSGGDVDDGGGFQGFPPAY